VKQIKIYYTSYPAPLPQVLFNRYLQMLPPDLQVRNGRFRQWHDRLSHLLGKMLLIKALEDHGFNGHCLTKMRYTNYQRPFLECEIDFNISHSGNYVLCAVAEGVKVGVDIEAIKPIELSEFTHVMSASQWNAIHSAGDPLLAFYRAWTIKESVIKAHGKGLSLPLTEIGFTNTTAWAGGEKWQLKEFFMNAGYAACLATNCMADIQLQYLHCVHDQFLSL
jgi:4'-phosphopantetheinyl transferase